MVCWLLVWTSGVKVILSLGYPNDFEKKERKKLPFFSRCLFLPCLRWGWWATCTYIQYLSLPNFPCWSMDTIYLRTWTTREGMSSAYRCWLSPVWWPAWWWANLLRGEWFWSGRAVLLSGLLSGQLLAAACWLWMWGRCGVGLVLVWMLAVSWLGCCLLFLIPYFVGCLLGVFPFELFQLL